MWLINLLNPVVVLHRLMLCIKDFSNYRFYRKTIKKIRETGLLKEKGMRTDWLRRVYFVINLLPETLLAQDTDLLEKSRVTEAIAERNQIFTQDGLLEIIQADYRRIKSSEYYAYLIWIKYRTLTRIWDWLHVIVWISVVAFAAINYQFFVDSAIQVKDWYIRINN